jgi:ferredoxin
LVGLTAGAEVPLLEVLDHCTCCGGCLLHCPERALLPGPGRPVVTAACTGCGDCIEICPADALRLAGEPGPDPSYFRLGTREGAR